MSLKYKLIKKEEFVEYLKNNFDTWSCPEWVYKQYWRLDQRSKEWMKRNRKKQIKEFCYLIRITEGLGILIYSSIEKRTGKSRENKKDSIKLVAVEAYGLKPIREKYQHVKRIDTWQKNFKDRVNYITADLKSNPPCETCGSEMILRTNSKSGSKFYGCKRYPNCVNTRTTN